MKHPDSLSEQGSAAVEFAITLPVLVVVLAGIFDYANAVNISTKLFSSARAGVQYGLYHPGDAPGAATVANSSTRSTTEGSTSYGVAAGTSATAVYYCIQVSTGIIDFAQPQTSAPDCNSIEGGKKGATGWVAGYFFSLTPKTNPKTYTPFLSYSGLGDSLTMSGSALIQVQ